MAAADREGNLIPFPSAQSAEYVRKTVPVDQQNAVGTKGAQMPEDTIDLLQNYLLLEPDGAAVILPGGGEFWSQLMSGRATDSGIQRLMESEKGRLLSALSMGADWTNWEMHPAGDEILFMLQGEATFLLELADGLREVALNAGRLLLIPKGVWHTAKMREPARLLAITPGAGTQHRPA